MQQLGGKRGRCPTDIRHELIELRKLGRKLRAMPLPVGPTSEGLPRPLRRLQPNEALRRGQRLISEAQRAADHGACAVARGKLDEARAALYWAGA